MDFAYASGQNVLLVGPHGTGKTAIINDFIETQSKWQTVGLKRNKEALNEWKLALIGLNKTSISSELVLSDMVL